jgi:type VI secretion system protein ImpA
VPIEYADLEPLFGEQSATTPCGPNLEYDALFLEIEREAAGRPAVTVGEFRRDAVRPDWWRISSLARALLMQSKDARLAVYLLRALLATEGLAGLARGLYVIARLVRDRWTCLHPELEDGDATWRLNALAALSDARGVLEELRNAEAMTTAQGMVTVHELIELQRDSAQQPLLRESHLLLHLARRNEELRAASRAAAEWLEQLEASLVAYAGPDAAAPLRGLRRLVDDLRAESPDPVVAPSEDVLGSVPASSPRAGPLAPGYVGGSPEIDRLPEAELAEPPPTGTFFRVVRPLVVRPGAWNSFLVYLHAGQASAVDADSSQRLGSSRASYTSEEESARVEIARGAEVTVVPIIAGCRFNPRQQRVEWLEDVHTIEFRVQASPEVAGFARDRRLYGHVRVYVGPLLVGQVPTSLVASAASAIERPLPVEGAAARPFARVFVSYAREDDRIVELLQRAYELVRIDYLRDVSLLRSGDRWNPALLEAIDGADRFQLCWSAAASRSRYVEQEWRRALVRQSGERDAFICPFYWEKPMPAPPPELAGLHFAYFDPGAA